MERCACCDLDKPRTIPLHNHPDLVLCSDCLGWLARRASRQEPTGPEPLRVIVGDPVFPVRDVTRSMAHYEALGFGVSRHDESYGYAHRDNVTIHLAQAGDPVSGAELYLHVTDADELADAWRAAGVDVEGPIDEDYGKREGSHIDPDGNVLRFGAPLPSPDEEA
jgi:hypothetical protein